MSTRIQTANYTRIARPYLTEVVAPTIEKLEASRAPRRHAFKAAGLSFTMLSFSESLSDQFSRAFAHLPAADGDGELTVYVWDSVESGATMIPPWRSASYHSLETNTRYEPADGFVGVYMHFDDTMTLYDAENRRAYFWVHDASRVPIWISAAPLRTLLQWALSERHIHLVHGAVVADSDRAVLLTAKGGSGKSTTALSCLKAGMQYLADDYVAVSRGPSPQAYSLYNSIKVAPYDGSGFDPAHITETEGEKSVVYLSSLFPDQLSYSASLKAIMIPRVTHEEQTTITRATKAQAMLALLPTTLFQLPLAESDKVRQLSSIIDSLPCYSIELGSDSAEAAQVLRAYIRENL